MKNLLQLAGINIQHPVSRQDMALIVGIALHIFTLSIVLIILMQLLSYSYVFISLFSSLPYAYLTYFLLMSSKKNE